MISRASSSSSVLRAPLNTPANSARQPTTGRLPLQEAGAESIRIGICRKTAVTDHDRLQLVLDQQAKVSSEPLWIVLIGHGTFDGREAKFNLRGPDLTDIELSDWLAAVQATCRHRQLRSASGPFINRLSGTTGWSSRRPRVGYEMNFARFGQYISPRRLATTGPISTRTARFRCWRHS